MIFGAVDSLVLNLSINFYIAPHETGLVIVYVRTLLSPYSVPTNGNFHLSSKHTVSLGHVADNKFV